MALYSDFGLRLPIQQWLDEDDKLYEETLREKILAELLAAYHEKEELAGVEALRTFEKQMLLRVLDDLWKDHLATMDHLRHGIHLRGYAQKNPKQEYKREAFELFETLLDTVRADVTKILMTVQVRTESQLEEAETPPALENVQYHHADQDEALAAANPDQAAQLPAQAGPRVGRNDPCPCGSGKKYKHCHGKLS